MRAVIETSILIDDLIDARRPESTLRSPDVLADLDDLRGPWPGGEAR